ncbi:MAG: hypothetical protein KF845_00435 [Cyclobacteriaceae bacterium]|nr:hypothetical protein [Cyclobacteriaceae bacterium]
MNLEIDNTRIEHSFDRIAKDLLTTKALYVNKKIFRFTEIEFYYFNEKYHKDEYTHEHERHSGEWRFHNQGIDITFSSDNASDGGILIRGILSDLKFVNGPKKSIGKIFEAFGKVTEPTSIVLKDAEKRETTVIKTFRHLPNKITFPDFHEKHYRYLTDLENLKIDSRIKQKIQENHTVVL